MLGKHLIKSWSSTQTSISLSSGEAEFYGVVKASGISLGYQALLRDIGFVYRYAYGPIARPLSAYAGARGSASCVTWTRSASGSSSG